MSPPTTVSAWDTRETRLEGDTSSTITPVYLRKCPLFSVVPRGTLRALLCPRDSGSGSDYRDSGPATTRTHDLFISHDDSRFYSRTLPEGESISDSRSLLSVHWGGPLVRNTGYGERRYPTVEVVAEVRGTRTEDTRRTECRGPTEGWGRVRRVRSTPVRSCQVAVVYL